MKPSFKERALTWAVISTALLITDPRLTKHRRLHKILFYAIFRTACRVAGLKWAEERDQVDSLYKSIRYESSKLKRYLDGN
jgi:hypothetical protein